MDVQQYKNLIEDLVEIMKRSGLEEVDIRQDEFEIHLRRSAPQGASTLPPPAPVPVTAAGPSAVQAADPAEADTGLIAVKSPMVGTFYMAPAPDADPFVSEGDTVEPDTVVCIVEAMKVMNEIKAETSGRIARVCAESGQAVEFGQTLFLIEPQ